MNNDFYISITDKDRWNPTDKEGQDLLVKALVNKCNDISAGDINKVCSGLIANNSEADIVNSLPSGFSIPVLLTSIGYLLKHLSPLLIQYMKNKASKEITVDIHGKRITIKGGPNFEKELSAIIKQTEKLDVPDKDA
ncbi:MAG: hypothetical protein ABJN96_02360 [Marinomonas sp.]